MEIFNLDITKIPPHQLQVFHHQRMFISCPQGWGETTIQIDKRIVSQRFNENCHFTRFKNPCNFAKRFRKVEMMQNSTSTNNVEIIVIKLQIFGIHNEKCRI